MRFTRHARRVFCAALAAAIVLPAVPARAARAEEISPYISDYTGAGTVIAVIEAGFDIAHAAFSAAPAEPSIDENTLVTKLGLSYADAYVSEKIPLALDYTADGIDTGVYNLSDAGTAIASVAAGYYKGAGDTVTEDGKVIHESDFLGTAPDAQILFMKAAADNDAALDADAVSAAVRDAIRLGADVILTDFSRMETGDQLKEAFAAAKRANVPIYGGAGETSAAVRAMIARAPAALADRGTLPAISSYPAALTVGAARDPYAQILSFTAGEFPMFYADSSLTYLGRSFAQYFAGREIGITAVPGYGTAQDYENLDVRGKIAVVLRGEISFSDKAKHAAAAGAIGMIVSDNGGGISQMALTDSPIPAVMVTEADGAYLRGADAPKTVTFEDAEEGMASFSAAGAAEEFNASVAFSCIGQNVLTAGTGGYAYRSGTQYAAAKAAGYCARAVQYLRMCSKSADGASAILASAARPLATKDGTLPYRTAGAGVLDETCVFPTAVVTSANGEAVPMYTLSETSGSVRLTVTITNLTDEAKRYTLGADFSADEVDADGFFTGTSVPVTGVRCTTGLLSRDIIENETTVLVGAWQSVSVTLSVSLHMSVKNKLSALMPNGFFLDGAISFTCGTETISHPLSFFWGNPDKLPLSDASVFDGGAILVPATLSVRMPDTDGAYTIGTADRTAAIRTFEEAYSIVHPLALRGGALILNLTPLRNIDSITARFTDADGHVIYESALGSAVRYLTAGGQTAVPLWDFSAADNREYVFPDGAYTCEITLRAGGAQQKMTFVLHADSAKPVIDGITLAARDDGTRTLTIAASDNTALGSMSVYDADKTYALTFVSGKQSSLTAEIPAHLTAPIYIEATDYAGGYTVLRLTEADLAAMAEDTP